MEKTLKIKTTDYKKVGHSAFADKFVEIIQAILANIMVFTNLPIPQAILDAAINDIVTKTNKAKKGSETDKDARDVQAGICRGYLDTLANYVLQVASMKPTLEQQIEVVNLSKFTLVKIDHEPTPPLPQVEGVAGKWTGHENDALIEWDRIEDGVAVYNVYRTFTDPTLPGTVWELAGATTRKKIVIRNLAPRFSTVWVRVVAMGHDEETSVPSDPALVAVDF